jgi:hypothetical protein
VAEHRGRPALARLSRFPGFSYARGSWAYRSQGKHGDGARPARSTPSAAGAG